MSYFNTNTKDRAAKFLPKRPPADYGRLAEICLNHNSGDCLRALDRLAAQLGLSARDKLRLRHMLEGHAKPYREHKE